VSRKPSHPPKPDALPERPYYRIGQVASLLGVEPHVLRFWESQFPQLRPTRAPSGHRLYRREHVETALIIHRLLYQEGYTIAGARRRLAEMSAGDQGAVDQRRRLVDELKDILRLLDG